MSQEHDEKLRDFFVPENRQTDTFESHISPSGKYSLEIAAYDSPEGANGTQGAVRSGGRTVTVVNRNYGHFPFAWAEGHPNGHDYLICGENYMGQTVIELDTGKRRDYVEDEGFCWCEYSVSPHRQFVAVHGCYWACPFELRTFDVSDFLALPYKKLWEMSRGRDVRKFTWNPDNSLEFLYALECSPELKKTTDQMTVEEQVAHYKSKNRWDWRVKAMWRYPDQEEIIETQVLGAKCTEGYKKDFAARWHNWEDTPTTLGCTADE